MSWTYQRRYLLANPGPTWTCYFCPELIDHRGVNGRALAIHHVDHDHENDVLENLASAHRDCHNSYHSIGFKHSDETKAKIGAAQRGKIVSQETRMRQRESALRRAR